jgi:hypothetical protein
MDRSEACDTDTKQERPKPNFLHQNGIRMEIEEYSIQGGGNKGGGAGTVLVGEAGRQIETKIGPAHFYSITARADLLIVSRK